MDTIHFYVPQVEQVASGLRLALNLIRKYLPEGAFSRIYLDEQPVDSGNYVAGAVALENGDMNTAGFAMFKIKQKTDGVRMYWAQQAEAPMSAAEAPIPIRRTAPCAAPAACPPSRAPMWRRPRSAATTPAARSAATLWCIKKTQKRQPVHLKCTGCLCMFRVFYQNRPPNRKPPKPPQQQLHSRFSRIMLQHHCIRPPGRV